MRKTTFLTAFMLSVGAFFSVALQAATPSQTNAAITPVKSGLTVATPATPTVGPVLKHAYTFEDGTAKDTVGTVNGTINGPTAKVENGVFVSSSNGDFISFSGAELALNTYTTITTEAYIRAGAGTNPSWTVFAYFGGANGDNAYLTTVARNDNRSQTEFVGGGMVIGPELEDGLVHHLVSVLRADSIKYYLDGVLLGASGQTKALSLINTTNAWLCKGGWPDATWNGSIYEYNIYEGEMDKATVMTHADKFLGSMNADLSAISSSVGLFTPAFNPGRLQYALTVPFGTQSVNISVAPKYSVASTYVISGQDDFTQMSSTLSNNVDVNLVDGKGVAGIQVISQDNSTIKNYAVYVSVADTCFMPFYSTGNLVADPEVSDLANFGGWGSKTLAVAPQDVYCGPSSGQVNYEGSIDAIMSNGKFAANKTYRVRAMVKTAPGIEFQVGVWGWGGNSDITHKVMTEGTWKQVDFTFTTTANVNLGNCGVFFNNWSCVGTKTNAAIGQIDNWEVYDITAFDTRLKSLSVSGGDLKPAFSNDVKSYSINLPFGTDSATVAAAAYVPGATVTGTGKIALTGNDKVKVKVVSVDGLSKDSVMISITTLKMKHSYNFEDGTANDAVGTVNGTINGSTAKVENGVFVSSTNGDFIQFDGAALALNTYGSITTEAYIRAGAATNPSWTVFAYFGGATGNGAYLTTIARNDNRSQTEFVGGGMVIGPELEDGNLHHIVSVLRADSIKYYLDGVLLGASGQTKPLSQINTTNAWLCKGGWPDATWNGSIFEYNIYEGRMDAAMVKEHADAFLSASSTTLTNIATSVGSLTPAFNPALKEYAVEVPVGTTSVNVAATPKYSNTVVSVMSGLVDFGTESATITNNADITLVDGSGVASIGVLSVDGTSSNVIRIYISVKDTTCYTPLMATGNLVADPNVTSLSNFGGWGTKSIAVNPADVYCGITAGQVIWQGSIDAVLSNKIAANANYRVRAMVKTGSTEFQLGVWGWGGSDINNKFTTNGVWKQIDFTYSTSATANLTNSGVFFNNWACAGTQTDAAVGQIDNWEVYPTDVVNSLTVKYVGPLDLELKAPVLAQSTAPLGTILKASAADKTDITLNDIRYTLDPTTVDSVALALGENVITLKFTSTVNVINPTQLNSRVYMTDQTLNVLVNMSNSASVNVDVVGLQGNIVASKTQLMNAGQNHMTFDLPVNGVYMVRINSGDKTSVLRIVK